MRSSYGSTVFEIRSFNLTFPYERRNSLSEVFSVGPVEELLNARKVWVIFLADLAQSSDLMSSDCALISLFYP